MNFFLPVALYTGAGAVRSHAEQLASLGNSCLIVTGGSAAKRSGALDDVTSALTERGITYQIFDKIRPNPTMASCIEGGRLAKVTVEHIDYQYCIGGTPIGEIFDGLMYAG